MLGLLTYFWDLCSTGTEYSGSCELEFDGAIDACASRFRRESAAFNVFAVRQSHLIGELRKAGATVLVLNDFAHVHRVEHALAGCYATHLAGRGTAGGWPTSHGRTPQSNVSGVAHELARRDIVRYLSARAARIAALLAQSPLGRSLRVVYRTSSPAADRYLRGSAAIDVPVLLPHVAVDISAASAEYGHDIYLSSTR